MNATDHVILLNTNPEDMHFETFLEVKARCGKLLLTAINEGLSSILGERSKESVFLYLGSVLLLEKERMCDKPEIFDAGLGSLFDSSASF